MNSHCTPIRLQIASYYRERRGRHAGDSGNPDSNPDKVSGYGPSMPPTWWDSGQIRGGT